MNQYALFLGCQIPARVQGYERSVRTVLHKLGLTILDIPEFTCCGYPMRNLNRIAFLASAARNLALAEARGRDVLTLCMCCFGTLKKAEQFMQEDAELKERVNAVLAEEGLHYAGKTRIRHLFNVLYQEVGLQTLNQAVCAPIKGARLAIHYGCHALRPSDITLFDDAIAPSILEEMLEITGGTPLKWDTKYDCCGAPLLGIDNDLSLGLARRKLALAHQHGADYLCTGCPYCHLQFSNLTPDQETPLVRPILLTQIMGLAMGARPEELGLEPGFTLVSTDQT
ncbi:CoB--CoM heterodisulfide reductase iron-sulfur subunit B family protein [Desulfoplanes formicivorans]|uniref:Disulfide reductase n=1 Tax=Desulfoplanes formicivorans TaxID=1592317 RepID=A0A194AGS9_9BACT|nr:CoB--CoM heterodisulfide reductase iron-sulfur subunit B family protein [Desulfoplanes formicivorans]GAU08415.1 disulfide reductase [Desulfoplanes formicivorans]